MNEQEQAAFRAGTLRQVFEQGMAAQNAEPTPHAASGTTVAPQYDFGTASKILREQGKSEGQINAILASPMTPELAEQVVERRIADADAAAKRAAAAALQTPVEVEKAIDAHVEATVAKNALAEKARWRLVEMDKVMTHEEADSFTDEEVIAASGLAAKPEEDPYGGILAEDRKWLAGGGRFS